MRIARSLVIVICALAAIPARAEPPAAPAPAAPAAPAPAAPAPASPAVKDKGDAKALMRLGLRLFVLKDFLGALAVFKNAYALYPSPKILVNIGTTLTKLDRKAEAANVYQRYLDAPDSDANRLADIKRVLRTLDPGLAIVELSVTPAGAEIQINGDDWAPADALSRLRVAPGSVVVRARHAGYQPGEQTVLATAGGKLAIDIALVETPAPIASPRPVDDTGAAGLRAAATVEPPRARIGAIALAHVDVSNGGGAGLIGVTVDVTRRLQAQAAVLLGPSSGGYAGASFVLRDGTVRPIASAGLPIFASNGARVALRAAGGVELALNRHLALIAELGVEYLMNPEDDVERTLFVPAIGAAGRL